MGGLIDKFSKSGFTTISCPAGHYVPAYLYLQHAPVQIRPAVGATDRIPVLATPMFAARARIPHAQPGV